MGLFYVRVDVRSHVNNGPLNNLCIVCMWRCIVSLMFTHKPMWVVWLMKMGDCEPSYGYGKAHVVSGHWFSPWHTGREPDLSNPFQGLFSRMPCGAKGSRLTVGVWGPGVCSPAVSAHVRARTLWQGRWGTVPKGVRGGKKGEGCRRGSRGRGGGGVARAFGFADCLVFGLVSYVVSYVVFGCFCLPPERFRTVQGYSALKKAWKTYVRIHVRTHVRTHVTTHVKVSERFRTFRTVQTVSGVFPPEKGMKNLRKNSRKNSRNNPWKGFWTVQGFPRYHVKKQ